MLNRTAIAARLPHAGEMVLLDSVTHWDDDGITCLTRTHLNAENPLRRDGALCSICGVEYAAQAMALHGALMTGGPARQGVLASVKSVTCHRPSLDERSGEMVVTATKLLARADSSIYGFSLHGAETLLLDGQAAVFLR